MRRGFTLIELLVVIAIIGLLSSVVLASLNTARTRASDAKVRADLHQLSTALYLYFDEHGTYPPNPSPGSGVPIAAALEPLVTEGYMPELPTSPNQYGYRYYFYNTAPNVGALLVSNLESAEPSTGYAGTCRPFSNSNWCRGDQNNTYYCLCHPY